MAYWLFKSEPGAWSWDQQVQKGDTGEGWDGVRNYQAANNMKAMNIGDLGFFYHSVAEKQIVGIVDVIAPYHPDPTDASGLSILTAENKIKIPQIDKQPKPLPTNDDRVFAQEGIKQQHKATTN